MWEIIFCSYNSIAIKVQLKDLTHMFKNTKSHKIENATHGYFDSHLCFLFCDMHLLISFIVL
jgi:hypothetical protein